MHPDTLSRRTVTFVNIAHALDHFVLLIYPTAVIAIAAERGLDYGALIGLATGAFVAFGLFSLPMGWLSERFGRRNLLAAFFGGCGLACLGHFDRDDGDRLRGLAFRARGVLGDLSSDRRGDAGDPCPAVGARPRLERGVGQSGGRVGIGRDRHRRGDAGLAGRLRGSGMVCLAAGAAFLALVPGDGEGIAQRKGAAGVIPVSRPIALMGVFALAIIAGGVTFNVTTISLPKVIDERLGLALPLALTGSLATAVFVFGALTQLAMGRLVDRFSLPSIFVGISILQPVGLGLAAMTTGVPMLAGLVLAMAAIYGQVVVNDAMVARYVPAQHRAKAFSVRYFLGFTTSGFAVPLIALLHGQGGFARGIGGDGGVRGRDLSLLARFPGDRAAARRCRRRGG